MAPRYYRDAIESAEVFTVETIKQESWKQAASG
jgi:hypothetical protein